MLTGEKSTRRGQLSSSAVARDADLGVGGLSGGSEARRGARGGPALLASEAGPTSASCPDHSNEVPVHLVWMRALRARVEKPWSPLGRSGHRSSHAQDGSRSLTLTAPRRIGVSVLLVTAACLSACTVHINDRVPHRYCDKDNPCAPGESCLSNICESADAGPARSDGGAPDGAPEGGAPDGAPDGGAPDAPADGGAPDAPADGGAPDAPADAGACAGESLFCDDFSKLDPSEYAPQGPGSWGFGADGLTLLDNVAWHRDRALLRADYSDFEVTLVARSLGGSGFGLVYATSQTLSTDYTDSGATEDGYAIAVHLAQFHGVYLKQLFKGSQDRNIACHYLTPQAQNAAMTLQVRRAGSCVAVWLDGNPVLGPCNIGGAGADPGKRLGLWVSATENPNGAGAQFSFLRVNGLGAGALRCPDQCSATHVISGGCSE